MKRVGKITICFAVVFVCHLLHADEVAPTNAYAPIASRNNFALRRSQEIKKSQNAELLPLITPNGIATISGTRQVFFKVSAGNSGTPVPDESYVLEEGQTQNGIEVIGIDQKAGVVTFNNHGTVQKISLHNAQLPSVYTLAASPATIPPPVNHPAPAAIPNQNNGGGMNVVVIGNNPNGRRGEYNHINGTAAGSPGFDRDNFNFRPPPSRNNVGNANPPAQTPTPAVTPASPITVVSQLAISPQPHYTSSSAASSQRLPTSGAAISTPPRP